MQWALLYRVQDCQLLRSISSRCRKCSWTPAQSLLDSANIAKQPGVRVERRRAVSDGEWPNGHPPTGYAILREEGFETVDKSVGQESDLALSAPIPWKDLEHWSIHATRSWWRLAISLGVYGFENHVRRRFPDIREFVMREPLRWRRSTMRLEFLRDPKIAVLFGTSGECLRQRVSHDANVDICITPR